MKFLLDFRKKRIKNTIAKHVKEFAIIHSYEKNGIVYLEAKTYICKSKKKP